MTNYNLFKERNKNGKLYYYVQFYNEIGQRQTKKSVEVLRKKLGILERHHITKNSEASYIVQQAIENGFDDNGAKTDPLFADYLQEFWNFDISPYVVKRNKMRSGSLGRDYCYNRLLDVKNHIIPNLPKGLKCSQVKKSHIEKVQEKIIKESSVSVWVNCSRAIFTPIKELLRKGILFRNPLLDLDKYTVSNVSTVGTLTAREIEKLVLQMFQDVHTGRTCKKKVGSCAGTREIDDIFYLDNRVFLATALSACTGMRKGEILALRVGSIRFPNSSDKFEDTAIIDVNEAYANRAGFKLPKNKKVRQVPVPRWLAEDLIEFAKTQTTENQKTDINNLLVFYSVFDSSVPVDLKIISKWFNRELAVIGISEAERRKRHIVFHSLRHYFNTSGVTVFGQEKTALIMGHSTGTSMTRRYDNGSDERLLELGKITAGFIPNPHTYIQTA